MFIENETKSVDNTIDALLEEFSQTANGPELEKADGELDNEATEERDAKEMALSTDNGDAYSSDEHKQSEDLEPAEIKEESQTANGPELEKADGELDNEATEEGAADEKAVNMDNSDVYTGDEHEQAEEAKAVEIKEAKSTADLLQDYNQSIKDGADKVAAAHKKAEDSKSKVEIKAETDKTKVNPIRHPLQAIQNHQNYKNKLQTAKDTHEEDYQKTLKDNNTQKIENDLGGKAAREAAQAAKVKHDAAMEEKRHAHEAAMKDAEYKKKEAEKNLDANTTGIGSIRKGLGKIFGFRKKFRKPLTEMSDYEIMSLLDEAGYEPTEENVAILREDPYAIFEDELETNPEEAEAERNDVLSDEPAPTGDASVEDSEEVVNDLLDVDKTEEKPDELSESMRKIFALVDSLNEEISQTANGPELEKADGELDNEATEKGNGAVEAPEMKNSDVYCDHSHTQADSSSEVVVESAKRKYIKDDDLTKVETTYEYYDDKDAEDNENRRVLKKKVVHDKVDGSSYTAEEADKKNSGKSDRQYGTIKESEQVANGPEIDQPEAELKDEATEKKAAEEKPAVMDNADVYTDAKHDQSEEEKAVEIKESEQVANGPEIDQPEAELKDEATEKGEGKVENPVIKNTDVYCDCCHKSVQDVVGVVVESVRELKAEGTNLTIDAITESVKEKLGSDIVVLEEKVASEPMQSVQYNSLTEACLLDENYFTTDSYILESADEKVEKLTEQVALLIAREQNDPMYDELLKESAYVMRLQEALTRKYKKRAEDKNRGIIGNGGKGIIGHKDQSCKRS